MNPNFGVFVTCQQFSAGLTVCKYDLQEDLLRSIHFILLCVLISLKVQREASATAIRQIISQLPSSLQQQWLDSFEAFRVGWNEAREYQTLMLTLNVMN